MLPVAPGCTYNCQSGSAHAVLPDSRNSVGSQVPWKEVSGVTARRAILSEEVEWSIVEQHLRAEVANLCMYGGLMVQINLYNATKL